MCNQFLRLQNSQLLVKLQNYPCISWQKFHLYIHVDNFLFRYSFFSILKPDFHRGQITTWNTDIVHLQLQNMLLVWWSNQGQRRNDFILKTNGKLLFRGRDFLYSLSLYHVFLIPLNSWVALFVDFPDVTVQSECGYVSLYWNGMVFIR